MLLYCNFISLYGYIMILLFLLLFYYYCILLLYYYIIVLSYRIIILPYLLTWFPIMFFLLRCSHISMSWNYLCSYMHRFAVHICSMFSKHICFMIFGSTTLGAKAMVPLGPMGPFIFSFVVQTAWSASLSIRV